MSKLYSRLKRRMDMTVKSWKNDCRFSKKLAFYRVCDELGGRLGFKRLSAFAHGRKDEWILGYLQNKLASVIEKYKFDDNIGKKVENAPIWICWWTGEDSAPPLVQRCIESIRKNSNGHPVILITKENYGEYLTIPDYILDKVNIGCMGLAHLADYIRVCLLEKYGGLWLDTTIFCSDKIPEEYFNIPFFTCKSEIKKGMYLSDFQWVTFCLGGYKNHVIFRFLKAAFEYYWSDEDTAIDYLFFDDLIYIGKENIESMRLALDSVPINNIHRDDLQAAMNAALPASEFENVIKSDTRIYKLSWRETYIELSPDGCETVFGYFLRGI